MGGIAGIAISDLEVQPHRDILQQMCAAIVHRGPDGEGFYSAGGVGLAVRRLGISDVAGEAQPIRNEEHSVWVVLDGNIYNFRHLRREMEARGHHFYTHSDSEVIVHLYEELGAGFVRELRGMFAIALWDDRRKKLLLARDRLGKKPLCYALDQTRLYFGSESKAILAVAPRFRNLNSQAVAQYLNLGYVPDPLTPFDHVQKLPAGHLLEFADGQITVRQYWDLPYYDTYSPESEEECLLELERKLFAATHGRMIAEVPVGALLSGGLDSSIVVAMMANASHGPVKTFSVGFADQELDETRHARLVAETFATDHHEVILGSDISGVVELMTCSLDEPFGDASLLPRFCLAQLARQHVTVALSGDGADEIFAGHERYRIAAERRAAEQVSEGARGSFQSRLFSRFFLQPGQTVERRQSALQDSTPWQERYVDELSFLPAFERETDLFSPGFRSTLEAGGPTRNVLRSYFENSSAVLPLGQLLYVDAKTSLAAKLLAKVDRMAMLHSLEVRSPMLDDDLVEWATGLTANWKLRGPARKYILTKLAERLGVPREVIYRGKRSCKLPVARWMRGELKDMLMILTEPRSLQRGYFEPAAIHKLLDDYFARGRDWSGAVWRLLMLELWHRNFVENLATGAGAVTANWNPGSNRTEGKARAASAGAGD